MSSEALVHLSLTPKTEESNTPFHLLLLEMIQETKITHHATHSEVTLHGQLKDLLPLCSKIEKKMKSIGYQYSIEDIYIQKESKKSSAPFMLFMK